MEEKFGTLVYDGKMINLDSESLEKLSNISIELNEKYNSLYKKSLSVFNQ